MSDAYDRVTVRGVTLNKRTAALISEMEKRLGYELTLTQGSYNAGGVPQSAGTHDGGGAVDLSANDADRKIRVGRRLGLDLWHRLPTEGDWPEHLHGIMHDDREASAGAKAQMVDYENHLNGLASHLPDKQRPHPDPPVVFNYPEWKKAQAQAARRRVRVANAFRRAINALVNARKNTDAKQDKAEIQRLIRELRNHRH